MKKLIPVFMLAIFVVASCAPHIHVVGQGAQGMEMTAKRQWYLIDLAKLNEVDSQAMAEGAMDYTIETQANFVDVLITVIVPFVTSRTVTVTK